MASGSVPAIHSESLMMDVASPGAMLQFESGLRLNTFSCSPAWILKELVNGLELPISITCQDGFYWRPSVTCMHSTQGADRP